MSMLFADDTSLACSEKHVPDIEGILDQDLHMISQWADRWLVMFNPSKTVAMLFTKKMFDLLTYYSMMSKSNL